MSRDVLELATSLGFLDELYDRYQQHPSEIDPSWHELLDQAGTNGHGANGSNVTNGNGHAAVAVAPATASAVTRSSLPAYSRPGNVTMSPITAQATPSVWPLVNAFRSRGHFQANLDPLGLLETAQISELDPATWGFTSRDLDR